MTAHTKSPSRDCSASPGLHDVRLGCRCRKGKGMLVSMCAITNHWTSVPPCASMRLFICAADRQPGMESLLQFGFIIITYVCVCVCALALVDFSETTNSQAWYRSQLAEVGEGMYRVLCWTLPRKSLIGLQKSLVDHDCPATTSHCCVVFRGLK